MPLSAFAQSEGIAVVVNEGVLTYSDIVGRTDLVIASSGLPNTPETRQKLAPQIVRTLIEEELQLQEAVRLGLEVTEQEVKQEFAAVAAMNNLEADQFEERLVRSGADVDSLHRQIRARIAWAKVFGSSLRPQVRISETDVEVYLERQIAQIGKTEYLLSEILLPVDTPEDEAQVTQLAQQVVEDLRAEKAPFAKVAQQISQAPGAAQGGVLGWVQGDQLDEKIMRSISAMPVKTISDPVRSLAGYHIFYLSDKRDLTEESLPSAEEVRQKIVQERSERLSRSRLNELRSAAFIQVRL